MSSIETFLDGMSKFCSFLMPVAGLAILIYLVLFIKELTVTLKSVTKTLDTANDRLKQLDGPLNTVDEISQTIDEVHAAAKDVAMRTAQKISEEVDSFKNRKQSGSEEVDIVDVTEPEPQESKEEEVKNG